MRIVKDEYINFEDGNIVLLAYAEPGRPATGTDEDMKQTVYAFKCHKGVLASHSEIFQQMFGVPGSPEDGMVDGVPQVVLTDDWRDIRSLLRLVYGHMDVPRGLQNPSTVKVLSGPLRLAKKYMMANVWNTLIKIFEEAWPSRLKDWYAMDDAASSRLKQLETAEDVESDAWYSWDINEHAPDPLSTIQLATELDIPQVLRAAFYDLNRIYFAIDPDHEAERFDDHVTLRSVHDLKPLTDADALRFLRGRERMRVNTILWLHESPVKVICPYSNNGTLPGRRCQRTYSAPDPKSWPCERHVTKWMKQEADALRLRLVNSDYTPNIFSDPLGHLRRLQEKLMSSANMLEWENMDGMCQFCHHWLAEVLQREAQELWDHRIPAAFEFTHP